MGLVAGEILPAQDLAKTLNHQKEKKKKKNRSRKATIETQRRVSVAGLDGLLCTVGFFLLPSSSLFFLL
jgi:hypothetical protein